MTRTASLPCTEVGVGIDTHRYFHQAEFLDVDAQAAAPGLSFEESVEGYAHLREALEKIESRHPDVHFHIRLDAAGQYAANLERFLRGLPFKMTFSVGEPARNKHYRQAIVPKRGKGDVTDSYACGRFAVIERPSATPEDPEAFRLLREVAGRLESRVRQTTRAINGLHNILSRVFPELATTVSDLGTQYVLELLAKYPTPEAIAGAERESLLTIAFLTAKKADQIQAAARRSVGSVRGEIAEQLVRSQVGEVRHAKQAEKVLEELLRKTYRALPKTSHIQVETIIGIGELTAAVLVAKIVSIDRFPTKGRLVCYFGTFPEANQSGRDKYGNPVAVGTMEMSQQGSDLVRRYLWMAAKSAAQYNPAVRALYTRLRARGKRGDVAYGHCMRKLLHLVFAVWKTDRPFDPNHYPWETAASGPKAQQETAGRKQDMPEKEAITAAESKVDVSATPVKRATLSQPASSGRWVDFACLRQQVTMEQVLQHVGCLDEMSKRGSQRRGRCPIHTKPGERNRSFSVDVKRNVFQCFEPHCAAHGNVLDFWAAWHRLPLREAALELAETFHLQTLPNREEEPVRLSRSSVPPTPRELKHELKTGRHHARRT
jgi:transposase